MAKKNLFFLIFLPLIAIVALFVWRLWPALGQLGSPLFSPPDSSQKSDVVESVNQRILNEAPLDFEPSYTETAAPLGDISNYQAIKEKYGLSLSETQEKFLDDNRFLLLDSSQVNFLNPQSPDYNFDQWLSDSDRFGGGSIYSRKPEDSVLITPDTVLHAYHRYFELTLEELEKRELSQALRNFLSSLQTNLEAAAKNSSTDVKSRYERLDSQVVVARVLLDNQNEAKPAYFASPEEEQSYQERDKAADSFEKAESLLKDYGRSLPTPLLAAAENDLRKIYKAEGVSSSDLFSVYDPEIKADFTQFTPRSHYTKDSASRAYFRAMMYLGHSSYLLNSDLAIGDINLLVKQMGKKNGALAPINYWHQIVNTTSFYAGVSDDLSYDEWREFTEKLIGQVDDDSELVSAAVVSKLSANLNLLRLPRILSDVIVSENIGNMDKNDLLKKSLSFRIFGQKFSYDAWILNGLTAGQEKKEASLPSMPSALFIPAAFGSQMAKENSLEFLRQDSDFNEEEITSFSGALEKKAQEIKKVEKSDWLSSLGSAWLYVLSSFVYDYGHGYPLYMQAVNFSHKQIQTFLGSYAELKHDTLLYAKQSFAEMGAGGEDSAIPPVVKGFVEPNLIFWRRLLELVDEHQQLFVDNNLFREGNAVDRLNKFRSLVSLYSRIAEQELRGQAISADDYEALRTSKLYFMAQPFTTIDPTATSGQTALIADIHTDAVYGQILYEATAKPYFMIALVGNEDSPRAVAGLVYNHYEFKDDLSSRHSDEWWRGLVYGSGSLPLKNFWYKPLGL
jgi:hypothetical protein